MQSSNKKNKTQKVIFNNNEFILDGGKVLFWPDRQILIVSDLHFEKSTFLLDAGHPLPPYDTIDTLLRLEEKIKQYDPKKLICLGDSFHDKNAYERMDNNIKKRLFDITNSVDETIWIEGNHDSEMFENIGWQYYETYKIGNIIFSHEKIENELGPQIIGHYHPKIRTNIFGSKISGCCFLHSENLFVMPAFGTFTGGLDINNKVFNDIFSLKPISSYLIYKENVYKFVKESI